MSQLVIDLITGNEYVFDISLSGTTNFSGITGANNVGSGTGVLRNIDNNTLYLYSLSGGSGIQLSQIGNMIVFSASTSTGNYVEGNLFDTYTGNTENQIQTISGNTNQNAQNILDISANTSGLTTNYVNIPTYSAYTSTTYINISGITTASGETNINNGLVINTGDFLLVDAVYDDLRVPVSTTEVAGSNPPVDGIFLTDNPTGGTGTALAFNGTNQYVQIPHDATLDFSDDYSIEFWVRPKPSTTPFSDYFTQKNGSFYISYISTSRVRWQVSGFANLDSSTSLNVNAWNHVVCVLNNSGAGDDLLTIYINGINAGTVGPTFGTPGTSTNDLFIGSGNNGSNPALCDIDEIRFWQKAMTPSEVQISYNNGSGILGTDTTNLMAGYHFDEDGGTVVFDYSLNNNSGVTMNNPTWISGHIGTPTSRGVLTKYFTTGSTQELYFSVQMPHSWKSGSTILPHIHWSPEDDQTGSVVWGLEYTWANIQEVFPKTEILYVTQEVSGKSYHHMTRTFRSDSMTGITKTNGNESSMLICRVFREPSNSGDTYPSSAAFHEIDFHYLVEKFGEMLPPYFYQ